VVWSFTGFTVSFRFRPSLLWLWVLLTNSLRFLATTFSLPRYSLANLDIMWFGPSNDLWLVFVFDHNYQLRLWVLLKDSLRSPTVTFHLFLLRHFDSTNNLKLIYFFLTNLYLCFRIKISYKLGWKNLYWGR